MQIRDKRFLVIGGAGFIGSHLVDQLLAEGAASVLVYDNFSRGTRENLHSALADPRCRVFADGGDILHRDILHKAMENVDGVFHLAALWLLQCLEYPRSAYDVNVTGTMNVVEAAINQGVKKLVFSSSASVYGDAVTEPMQEDHPFNCQEFYGASKVCGEMLIRALVNREHLKGGRLQQVGLRYMNVYGPRQDDKGAYIGVVTRMLNALDAEEAPLIHGDGSQSYDFVDVRDCARANILAMQGTAHGSNYNVGTGIKTSIAELAAMLTELHPSGIHARFEPMGNRPFVKNRVGATDRARKELGFEARTTLREGLQQLIQWRLQARSH
ncbi:NAD-dependent epimerase/dehydratase family protein [Bordetella hinzii]|uniref:3-beta hydroxysteroid dehydrogenase/isomerase family protein n=1 Tax=Bordetella hinzii OH87 BAL007II TaxID=1331262 RepID=A0ABR4QZ38_9BORD|nr:NAD-dependent epimerase/dehydratase family protein [Bordetella hinzii]AKQ53454.1 UDP-glucose 4-epimerase [Bordetella hinzii]KCB23150.1 3-beta hydroxysteroid dehydrogenase/isomerase family protein [Bordetella hinzii OH87 BAL007II]KCB28776.1 3-beta hydroxysteroid dehydrogenase/isomerase family protein [Bordetella hinzii CA90 BAL1384]KCB29429.1 3-beta hydroxysteroid dehydrogenase/isomerase family protein [Bordetella hinzii L60]KCB42652.1 3-beta hydroxysteroid dehydrogenase/isomerase family pro